jgi:hypothetical protein
MDNRRRSSTGRSKILEASIMILAEFIKTKELEDFYGSVINNTLPGELRSIAWRIFLGILDKNDGQTWAKTTKGLRDNYYKISKDINDNVVKFLRNEINEEQAKSLIDERSFLIITTARVGLNHIVSNSDFFKSEIISELVIRLVYLWSLNHTEFNDHNLIVEIVAGIIYSLYPSILHIDVSLLGIDEEKLEGLEVQSIFYYLNAEEHFDADVYTIFESIMNKGVEQFIRNNKSFQPLTSNELSDLAKVEDEKSLFESAKKWNKIDRILGLYLRITNNELLAKIAALKNEIYKIFEVSISTILTKFLNSENIIYFWDCIFINEVFYTLEKHLQFENDFFHFTDFILLSYLIHNQDNAGKPEFGKILIDSLQTISGIDVVKKAIKLREKLNSFS